ncbi:hypothetical protein OG785_04300 [Streptomyces sp. NBC_00006]|uniref:hypothetical protein n=1 Tax=Streptomyces sp. NBC_00006 TaxID=2975619 RepID=UPI0022588A7D|nr:hypothetical protein [Streptomyces sp. NBC_00006]MCX5529783.1 hypothetical protein [Streptomyces sp. NBC_00006]
MKVRNEAAGYCSQLLDAETKFSGAKSPEEVEVALAEVEQKSTELQRSMLIGTLTCKFEPSEEIETDTKALQPLIAPMTRLSWAAA